METRPDQTKKFGPKLKMLAAVALIAVAVIAGWYLFPTGPKILGIQAFFSDDDGQTYFVDDGTLVAPFDHQGKIAVLAKVYETDTGKRFIGYLMKYTDEAKSKIEAGKITHSMSGPAVAQAGAPDVLLVKRPGNNPWISLKDPRAVEIMRVTAPAGSGLVSQVVP